MKGDRQMGTCASKEHVSKVGRMSDLLINSDFPIITEQAAKDMSLRVQGPTLNLSDGREDTFEEWTEKAVLSSLHAPNLPFARAIVMSPPPCERCGMVRSIGATMGEIEKELKKEGL